MSLPVAFYQSLGGVCLWGWLPLNRVCPLPFSPNTNPITKGQCHQKNKKRHAYTSSPQRHPQQESKNLLQQCLFSSATPHAPPFSTPSPHCHQVTSHKKTCTSTSPWASELIYYFFRATVAIFFLPLAALVPVIFFHHFLKDTFCWAMAQQSGQIKEKKGKKGKKTRKGVKRRRKSRTDKKKKKTNKYRELWRSSCN